MVYVQRIAQLAYAAAAAAAVRSEFVGLDTSQPFAVHTQASDQHDGCRVLAWS